MKDVSIVIITKNESANIGPCLESILSTRGDLQVELILVDSASTDQTVAIASRYPVTIVRLDPSPLLSPSVGRYVGSPYATAPFVQFLDGDMIMLPGWIASALQRMNDEKIGGVAGFLHRSLPGEPEPFVRKDTAPTGEVECFGGAALYRATALARAGTFNPYMLGEEERELGFRIRRAGYRLEKIPVDMAMHVEKVQDHGEVNEKSRYFRGVGQLIRGYPFTSLCWRIIRLQTGEIMKQLGLWGIPALLIVLAATGFPVAALVGATLIVFFVVFLLLWKGSRKVLLYAKRRVLIPWNIAKGIFIGIRPAEQFHISATVVKPERPAVIK